MYFRVDWPILYFRIKFDIVFLLFCCLSSFGLRWNVTSDESGITSLLITTNTEKSRSHLETTVNNNNFDEVVDDITNCIIKAGQEAIPNKIVTVRPTDYHWITSHIRKLIRKRKRTYRKYKQTNYIDLWAKYKRLRNIIISEIRWSKQEYFNQLKIVLTQNK